MTDPQDNARKAQHIEPPGCSIWRDQHERGAWAIRAWCVWIGLAYRLGLVAGREGARLRWWGR